MGFGQGARGDHLRTLSFDEAFAFYERTRHRLPTMPRSTPVPEHAANLADLADRFDVFLLDGFGVLNVGATAIPGAVQQVEALKTAGKVVIVLTNAASQPASELSEKYRRLGFSFTPNEIVSSRSVAMDAITIMRVRRWGVILPTGSRIDDLPAGHSAFSLEDDPEDYRAVEGFLLLGSAHWTDKRQDLLESALGAIMRPVVVGNPDIVAPREFGLTVEPGFFAHLLADRLPIEPQFFGKPHPAIFSAARARIDGTLDPARVLMVGDSLHTDILGAKTAGIASALVTGYGFLAGQSYEHAIRSTGIVPDFIIGEL